MTKKFINTFQSINTLFLFEGLERFSYYGMRSILVLYLGASLIDGGVGLTQSEAISIYGNYTSFVYFSTLIMGIIADFIGKGYAILIASVLLSIGHLIMHSIKLNELYFAFGAIIIASGLLRASNSNILSLVCDQEKRDTGKCKRSEKFALFYMAINIGSILGMTISGILAKEVSYSLAFTISSIAMIIGTIALFLFNPVAVCRKFVTTTSEKEKLEEKFCKKKIYIAVLISIISLYYFLIESFDGGLLVQILDKYCKSKIFGWNIPAAIYQSLNPLIVIIFTYPVSKLINYAEERKIIKRGIFLTLSSIILLMLAIITFYGMQISINKYGEISAIFPVLNYIFITFGEILMTPFALSLLPKMVPSQHAGKILGIWSVLGSIGMQISKRIALKSIQLNDLRYAASWALIIGSLIILIIFLSYKVLNEIVEMEYKGKQKNEKEK